MRLYRAISLFLICVSGISFAKWEKIGLNGKEVTAIAATKLLGNCLIAGTSNSGVFIRCGTGAFAPLATPGSAQFPAGLLSRIYCLGAFNEVPTAIFAGSDSGLYQHINLFGAVPRWVKVKEIPSTQVYAITSSSNASDTIIYSATKDDIYKSSDLGATWTACSTKKNLPPLQNMPWFTSLADFHGINAGSQVGASLHSWHGVLHSSDRGKSWLDISNLPGSLAPRVNSVVTLVCYRPSFLATTRLLASTSAVGGLFWTDDLDTGTWHDLEPQNKTAAFTHIYVVYHTRSLFAELFASSDSGVSVVSPKGEWVVSIKGHANGVTSLDLVDPTELFAAMEDGVYRYTPDPVSAIHPTVQATPIMQNINPSRIYTIDGKLLRSVTQNGIYLLKQGQSGLLKTFISPKTLSGCGN
jgi:hypothetical protein